MSAAAIPVLPRGVRLHDDRVRGTMVLLAPERAVMLDAIGAAVLARVDGQASLGAISQGLAADYDAPIDQVAADVADFLQGLVAERLVDLIHG